MNTPELAAVIREALQEDERIIAAFGGGTSAVMLGAWGERETQTVLLVDKDGDKFDLTLIPTNAPDELRGE